MIAVYPGTFDPLTKGHEDILLRSAKLFDHIIIAVAENPRKKTMITFKDRITLTQESFQNIPNIKVYGFTGMLIDFLKEHHANILIRGCRNITDAEYELSLQSMYKKLMPELEVILLPANPDVSFISSSLIRDIISHNGDTTPFVNQRIKEYIKKQF
jgi:pantetheine-phosphate adenylyltransferase